MESAPKSYLQGGVVMKLFLTSRRLDGLLGLIQGKPEDLRVGFVPTAASIAHGDCPWIHDDQATLEGMGFKLRVIHLEGKTPRDLGKDFEDCDIICVAGGNTFYLLQEARKSGFCDLAKQLVEKGVIYAGASAGAVLAGPTIEPVKYLDKVEEAPELHGNYTGLGFVPYVVIPHDVNEDGPYTVIFHEYGGQIWLMPLRDSGMILINGPDVSVVDI